MLFAASAPASAITTTIGLFIWFHIRAVTIGFVIARIAPTSAPVLMLLGRLVALARTGLLGVERVAFIYWNILTNHLLDTTQILAFIFITKGNGDSSSTCTPSTPNAVHIDLGLVRQI